MSENCGQGLMGALSQYWNIEPKARLHRRNTYFKDHQISNIDALKVGLIVSILGLLVLGSWCLGGAFL